MVAGVAAAGRRRWWRRRGWWRWRRRRWWRRRGWWRWRRRRRWWRRRRWLTSRPVQAEDLVGHAGVDPARVATGAPTRARSAEAAARVLPGSLRVRLHASVFPAPLTADVEVHVRLHGDPVMARAQRDRRRDGDHDRPGAVHNGRVRPRRDQHCPEDRSSRSRNRRWRSSSGQCPEVHAVRVDSVDRPAAPPGTTKSSARLSSNASKSDSKFCEDVPHPSRCRTGRTARPAGAAGGLDGY